MFVTEFKLDAAIIEDASVEQKSGCFVIEGETATKFCAMNRTHGRSKGEKSR